MSFPDCHPLIVEDDPVHVLVLRRTLGKIGVPPSQVFVAPDGQAAIDLLAGDTWTPSFVFLDLHLPNRSGLEVLEWIRNAPHKKDLPVFMFTTSSAPRDVSRAFELGVSSYFIKPLELTALEGILEGIAAWLGNRSTRAVTTGSLRPEPR